MYVVAVDMRTNDKRVLAFQKALCKFIPDSVRLFSCDLTRLERLSELISDNIVLLFPSGFLKIDLLTECKFFRGGLRSAFI